MSSQKSNPEQTFDLDMSKTLCQNYDLWARFRGYKCWNSYCALTNDDIKKQKEIIKLSYKKAKSQK